MSSIRDICVNSRQRWPSCRRRGSMALSTSSFPQSYCSKRFSGNCTVCSISHAWIAGLRRIPAGIVQAAVVSTERNRRCATFCVPPAGIGLQIAERRADWTHGARWRHPNRVVLHVRLLSLAHRGEIGNQGAQRVREVLPPAGIRPHVGGGASIDGNQRAKIGSPQRKALQRAPVVLCEPNGADSLPKQRLLDGLLLDSAERGNRGSGPGFYNGGTRDGGLAGAGKKVELKAAAWTSRMSAESGVNVVCSSTISSRNEFEFGWSDRRSSAAPRLSVSRSTSRKSFTSATRRQNEGNIWSDRRQSAASNAASVSVL